MRDCEFEAKVPPLAFKVIILHTCMKHQSHIYGTRYRLVFFIFLDSISSSTSSLQMPKLWHNGPGIMAGAFMRINSEFWLQNSKVKNA